MEVILWWAVILLVYGLIMGFDQIDPLFLLLFVPFLIQDLYDTKRRRR